VLRLSQPIPRVTRSDVERVAQRDFGETGSADAMRALAAYGAQDWHQDPVRVHLAVLKLANGDMKSLLHYVSAACSDSRDVIAHAEYPRYFKATPPKSESWFHRMRMFGKDWAEYESWLLR
jgi:hypothetical protein